MTYYSDSNLVTHDSDLGLSHDTRILVRDMYDTENKYAGVESLSVFRRKRKLSN